MISCNFYTTILLDTPGEVTNVLLERNYSSNVLIMIWDPLPTLDLTDIDPDILYTVELFKTTCGQNVPISHRIMSTNSASEESIDLMQIYKAVIAARNNVTEARNGPGVEIKGILKIFPTLHFNNGIPIFAEVFMSLDGLTLFKLARNSQLNMTVRTQ